MMKRELVLIAAGLLLANSAVFAGKSATINLSNANFSPVAWHASWQNGGFTLKNNTSKTEYVQVVIEKGHIAPVMQRNNNVAVLQELVAESNHFSDVYELAPNDTISFDLDFADNKEASGTYQVEMEK